MKNRLLFLMTLLCSLNAVSSDALPATVENPTDTALEAIPSLDVSRYMGTWFEIAKFPNSGVFQGSCRVDRFFRPPVSAVVLPAPARG